MPVFCQILSKICPRFSRVRQTMTQARRPLFFHHEPHTTYSVPAPGRDYIRPCPEAAEAAVKSSAAVAGILPGKQGKAINTLLYQFEKSFTQYEENVKFLLDFIALVCYKIYWYGARNIGEVLPEGRHTPGFIPKRTTLFLILYSLLP